MSILDDLLGALGGNERESSTPPTTLCPGDCPIGPGACQQCKPYKERLKEALYSVDHLEEFLARYEVTNAASTGATTCPHCGAPSADPFRCEYCGMQIREDDGKIRVSSANDIPDPIMEAQNIIFERHSAILGQAAQESGGGDLLSSLLDLFGGDDGASGSTLGTRMSKEEITEAAQAYGVSISTYLSGLDNGKYRTLSAKKQSDSASRYTGGATGVGLGGAMFGAAASSMLRGSNQGPIFGRQPTGRPPMEPPRREPPRPPEGYRQGGAIRQRQGMPGQLPRQGGAPERGPQSPRQGGMPEQPFQRQGGGRAAAPQQRATGSREANPQQRASAPRGAQPQHAAPANKQAAPARNVAPQQRVDPAKGNAPGGGRKTAGGQSAAMKRDPKSKR